MKSFLRFYPFIAAVTPYKSLLWEKLDIYYSLLVRKLPKLKGEDFTEGLLEAIDLDRIQVSKIKEVQIQLENKDTEIDPTPIGGGKGGKHEPEMVKLSDILDQFNEINWKNIELAKKQLDELPERLKADAAFVNAAKNSNSATAEQQCSQSILAIIAQMLNENTEFCRNYLDNPQFMNFINERVFKDVYKKIQEENKCKHKLIADIVSPEQRYNTYLPYYASIKAACHDLSEIGIPEEGMQWLDVSDNMGRLDKSMFVVKAMGNSMQPKINDGDYCVFTTDCAGSREGEIVLVEGYNIKDYDSDNIACTIKKYHSVKRETEDTWEHAAIQLIPLNKDYEPFTLDVEDESFRVLGILKNVIPAE